MKEKLHISVLFSLCLLLALSALGSSAGIYHGGSGTPDDPYRILTAAHLMELSQHTEDYDDDFILLADIDMDPDIPGNQTWDKAVIAACNSSGDTFDGIAFTGTFNGNGHSIKNLTFEYPNYSFIGLFGVIGPDALIENLGIENTSVLYHYGYSFLGFLAGENMGTIINCHSTGTITKAHWYYYSCVGGLIAKNSGVVFDCYSSGSILGEDSIGGLIGHNIDGYIQKCHSACSIKESYGKMGGLVGFNEGASYISYSYATGSNNWNSPDSGGLVGRCYGDSLQYAMINRCYATGSGYDGGLIGYINYSTVKNSFSIGLVNAGGLIANGYWYSDVINCFWDTDTSGTTGSYGNAIGLPTEDMKQQQTFVDAGWDFDSTWEMTEGRTYPYFQWQEDPLENLCQDSQPFPVGDLNSDCVVNLQDFVMFSSHWLEDVRR